MYIPAGLERKGKCYMSNESPDSHRNREQKPRTIADEIQPLQSSILDAAERHPVPDRFVITPAASMPRMHILDMVTGRSSQVPLYAYGEVRRVLADLFGEDAPGQGLKGGG
jgi:hypothetical protein